MPPQGDQCLFCQLLANPQETMTVHETDDVRAWLDVHPRARGHTMVVPKEHQESAEALGDTLNEMFNVARIAGEKAMNGLGADGYSVVMNNGEVAGQKQEHFYMIVFPRFAGEEREGTPTGAIFGPIEDMEESDMQEIHGKMEDASFNSFGGGLSTTYKTERGDRGPDDDEDDRDKSDRPDIAEFK